ncbi:MAG: DUF2065 domain-containing protein [Hyphomicrobium sp.]|uniref:DUF2065 domain-containing protein n=1 Tax=Hyphomicrobium sp. TaxID=82 RepID=UPI003D11B5F3
MSDLAVAFGLVLVIEGLLWALSPALGRHLLAAAAQTSEDSLRKAGWAAVAVGALVVWLVRG